MKRSFIPIPGITLPLLIVFSIFLVETAAADSTISIIGDRSNIPDDSGRSVSAPSTPSFRGSTTIRIIGDKSLSTQAPAREQAIQQEPNQSTAPAKAIRIIGDRIETVPKKVSEQPVVAVGAKKEREAEQAAVNKGLSEETTEQLLLQRLADLKAAEERKAVEKAEQERLATVKAEQERLATVKAEQEHLAKVKAEQERAEAEAEAAQRTAIKLEEERRAAVKRQQELLAARKAEELKKAADRAEQERIDALKADEERLAAARRALAKKLQAEAEPVVTQSGSNSSRADSTSGDSNSRNSDLNVAAAEANSTTQTPATIWDLYLSAKANDPALGRTEARVRGSKADSDLLFSALMPHLNSSASVKQISQTLKNYTTNYANYDFTALNYNMTASLTLLHVPTLYSLSAAAAGLSGDQAGVAAARQNLIVKLTDSYFTLLKAQTDKQIALGEINRLKQVLDQSQAFLKAGTGDIISVYEAQSRLDSAGADLTKSESNLRLAEQKLSSQVGKPVTEVVNYLPGQPAGPEPDNLDWWVMTMEKEQPVVRQAREGLSQTAEQRKAAKAEYLPVLQASGGYDVNRGTAALPTAEVRQWFVGASITLPLYSGGETSAKVRRAVAAEEERRHLFDETMDQQRENVKQAFFNLRYNISYIRALEQRKASAEIQLAAVKKGRKIGTRNAIDVLNAEQAYSVALRDYRYALYDNVLRAIQLKSAAGILTESDVSGLSEIEAPPPGNGLNMIISQASM